VSLVSLQMNNFFTCCPHDSHGFPMSYLKLLRPLSDLVKILTNMFGVEDGKSHRLVGVDPDLSQDACVDVAHQHLSYCVEAVGCVPLV
jgi:hypothetical protein